MKRVYFWIVVRTINMTWDAISMICVANGVWNDLGGRTLPNYVILIVNIPYIILAMPYSYFGWKAVDRMADSFNKCPVSPI